MNRDELIGVPRNTLVRLVLASFVVTFAICRIWVYLTMKRTVPTLYLHLGQTHVHHFNYGIWLLIGTGGCFVLLRPTGNLLLLAATVYGVALGLIFDEYGMWMSSGGTYWQQGSFIASVAVAAVLALVALMPRFQTLKTRHWVTAAVTILLLTAVGKLLARPVSYVQQHLANIEQHSPR